MLKKPTAEKIIKAYVSLLNGAFLWNDFFQNMLQQNLRISNYRFRKFINKTLYLRISCFIFTCLYKIEEYVVFFSEHLDPITIDHISLLSKFFVFKVFLLGMDIVTDIMTAVEFYQVILMTFTSKHIFNQIRLN